MVKLLFIYTLLIFSLLAVGQGQKKIIITSILETDRTITKDDKLFLDFRVVKHRITYTFDHTVQNFVTKQYLVEKYFSISRRDSVIKKRLYRSHKKWNNKITLNDFNSIKCALRTDIDTIKKGRNLHTSHNYFTIYIEIIEDGDTNYYSKTKPFKQNTPWGANNVSRILNPEIDRLILLLIPDNFLGREKLLPNKVQESDSNFY